MAQKPHEPTEQTRRTVEAMIAGGIPQDDVALVIGVDSKTLRKYYREEIDTAAAKANAKVAQTLFQKAINGDTTAAIWWTKGRMGWTEKRSTDLTVTEISPEKWLEIMADTDASLAKSTEATAKVSGPVH